MNKFCYKLWSKFLTIFGNIKVFAWPLWICYDPNFFKMTGNKIIELMDIIEPGDVILRGYDGYLDSKFIQSKRSYSHAGVYIGNNEIIHAVAPNVSKINIVDFCGCDRIAVVRPVKGQKKAIKTAKQFLKDNVPYDFNFTHGRETLYCFELAYECYKNLNIKKTQATAFFGLIKKKEPVVLSDCFFESPDFKLVFEYNPKYGIDLVA